MGKSGRKKSSKKQIPSQSKPELKSGFVEILKQDHPNQAEQILTAFDENPTIAIRLNPTKFRDAVVNKDHFLSQITPNVDNLVKKRSPDAIDPEGLPFDESKLSVKPSISNSQHTRGSVNSIDEQAVDTKNLEDLPHNQPNLVSKIAITDNSTSQQLFTPSLLPVPWETDAFYLQNRPSFTLDPLLHAGVYYVQDASSMLIGAVVRDLIQSVKSPLKILDLCAAPGGKSTHLVSVLSENDLLVSNEVIRSRANILIENLTKWGTSNFAITNNDPEHFQSLGSWFDVIIVDAPCSGEGLFRKDPQAMNEWSPDAVEHCTLRQNRILDAIWPTLNPGGFLVYSTCTFNRSENDAQVQRLIDTGEAESIRMDVNQFRGVIEEQNPDALFWMYRCFPGFIHGEGLTFSVIQKSPKSDHFYHNDPHVSRNVMESIPTPEIASALNSNIDWKFLSNKKSTFAIPSTHYRHINELTNSLNLIHAGVEVGDAQRPAHGLALNQSYLRGFYPEISVNQQTALQYLRRESIAVDSDATGIQIITYEGHPLGFGKAVRGRLNNHYPMEWRIRMR